MIIYLHKPAFSPEVSAPHPDTPSTNFPIEETLSCRPDPPLYVHRTDLMLGQVHILKI